MLSGRPRVLLVIPSSVRESYLNTPVRAAVNVSPFLHMATVGAAAREVADVEVLDLNLSAAPEPDLDAALRRFRPDWVGITSHTAIFPKCLRHADQVKAWSPAVPVVVGGPHPSARPEEALESKSIDYVVRGEGDFAMRDLIRAENPALTPGVSYKFEGMFHVKPEADKRADLDELPFPDWTLYDLERFRGKTGVIFAKGGLFASLETSRGCPYFCPYCTVQGHSIRYKSIGRVVEEFRRAKALGFDEVHLVDDSFSQDVGRATAVCEALIASGVNLPWTLDNGIRVDCVSREFFKVLRASGCWQVGFGIETGNERLIDEIGKKITLTQVREAVRMAEDAGIETLGFFILGLPGETEESLERTIRFAKTLPLTYAKFTVSIPYPGTALWDLWAPKGYIKSTDWSRYIRHPSEEPLYELPELSWATLVAYHRKAFRAFYWRPAYILRTLWRGLRSGKLWAFAKYAVQTRWRG